MLEYDEWAVPGEVEYAEKKAAEIEAQLKKYNKNYENSYACIQVDMRIQLTEHVAGIFEIKYPQDTWEDYDVTDAMRIGYFKGVGGCVDEPKIFDLPADDIRNSLPEWDESLLPDASRRDIMERHSIRYMVACATDHMEGDWWTISREFDLSDAKCDRIMETFIKKLSIKNKPVVFTEFEEKIADYIKYDSGDYNYWRYDYNYSYYEPWYFPLTMLEEEIIDAIHEAYLNASIKNKRRIPDKIDHTNIRYWSRYSDCRIENYECLFQGKGGDMLIRFLFDFKNMKIVMAYPVYRQIRENKEYRFKDDDSFADMIIYNAQLKGFGK